MKILVVCPHPVSRRAAGSNLRSLELARELAVHFDVTLGTPGIEDAPDLPYPVLEIPRNTAADSLSAFDIVLSNGTYFPARTYAKSHLEPIWIFDLYDPFFLGVLASGAAIAKAQWKRVRHLHSLYRFLMKRADLVLCASPNQRDFWLGGMHASGALRPPAEGECAAVDDLVRVVPFGIPRQAPAKSQRVLKGVHSGVGEEDKVLLWGGGIWNWLDPLTLIESMRLLKPDHPMTKLYFMGRHRQEDNDSAEPMTSRAMDRAKQYGLLNQTVFFGGEWVPFEKRGDYLLEGDLAVCLSPESMENTFSYRTRLTDAIWAGVPIVCTRGGFMGEWVAAHDCGKTVPGGDARAVAQAIVETLDPAESARMKQNIQAHGKDLRWETCVKPLVDFCRSVEQGTFTRRNHSPRLLDYLEYKALAMLSRL